MSRQSQGFGSAITVTTAGIVFLFEGPVGAVRVAVDDNATEPVYVGVNGHIEGLADANVLPDGNGYPDAGMRGTGQISAAEAVSKGHRLMPGESITFDFNFISDTPGIFTFWAIQESGAASDTDIYGGSVG